MFKAKKKTQNYNNNNNNSSKVHTYTLYIFWPRLLFGYRIFPRTAISKITTYNCHVKKISPSFVYILK